MIRETVDQALGRSLGLGLAALAFAGSALRNGRVLHPAGELYEADVEPAGEGAAARLGERLAGRALVRLSTGLRRGQGAKRDVLGCAIRFGWDPDAPEADAQDLLLVTAGHLLTLPLAPLVTDTRSFLLNDYHSIARFRTAALGTVRIRAVPRRQPLAAGPTRIARLACAVAEHRAVFELQARGEIDAHWSPFAHVTLTGLSDQDDADLLFTPYHAARGLEPVGFVNALRRAPYPASRAGRRFAAAIRGRTPHPLAASRRDAEREPAAPPEAVRTMPALVPLPAPDPVPLRPRRSSRARRPKRPRSGDAVRPQV